MMVAAFCAILHFFLHIRVAVWYRDAIPDSIDAHVRSYASLTVMLTLLETITWVVGIVVVPTDSEYRWVVFLVGIILSMRAPRSFLSNDFHGTT
jgi:hypothetical protein